MTDTFADLEPGFDCPALPGMSELQIQTPCLVLDLDALERNIRRMGAFVTEHGLHFRAHGKMHRSVDIARMQIAIGGARGICCQKVSEAEVFARGGIPDILVSNQVRDPAKIDRLARLPLLGAAVSVCLDDPANAAELSAAVQRHGTALTCLVEIDCGSRRCGVPDGPAALAVVRAILDAPGLTFGGLQAYHGRMQHLPLLVERQAAFASAEAITRRVVDHLRDHGIAVPLVTGGGTGSYELEAGSSLWTELQCGSYAFMDADYGRILRGNGTRLDQTWENALFLLTQVMSTTVPGQAVCDAGLKSHSVDSGLPTVFGRDLVYTGASDEHGTIADPAGSLKPGDRLRLVPGHCDPTCNLHDWYVGVRNGVVEALWPVSARGRSY